MAGRITGDESLEELQDLVAKLQKDVNWLMQGNLSSKNVREIGGYQVSDTLFQSRGGDVGLSSANDGADPVRLWAGSVDKDNAPWRVHKSGKMVATGALIQSSSGYPKVVMDPLNQLFGAYSSAIDYVEFNANYQGSPSFNVYASGAMRGQIASNGSNLFVAASSDLELKAGGDILLTPGVIGAKRVRVGWGVLSDFSSGRTLQTELNDKQSVTDAWNNYGVNMGFDSGTRNLKLFNRFGNTIATVNIP